MEDLVRERDYDDYSRSMEESIIKTSARYYEEKKEKWQNIIWKDKS